MSARKIQGKPPIIGATVRHGAHGKVDLNEVVRTGNRRQRRAAKSNKRMRAGAPTLEDPALGPPKEKGVHTMDAPTPDHEADKADTATGTALLDHVLAEVRCVGTTVLAS